MPVCAKMPSLTLLQQGELMTNNNTPHNPNDEKASAFKHPLMAAAESDPTAADKYQQKLTAWEIVKQAFALLAQIQNMKKFGEAADQMERSMAPVILAGIISMILFISLCMTGAYLALRASGLSL